MEKRGDLYDYMIYGILYMEILHRWIFHGKCLETEKENWYTVSM